MEIALTPTDEQIILACYRYHYLPREQLAGLLGLHPTYTANVLKKLVTAEYLTTNIRPTVSYRYFYMVGKQGVKYLSVAHDIKTRVESRYLSYEYQVPHLLLVNETMCIIERFAKTPHIELIEVLHDFTLKEDNLPATADVWAHLRMKQEELRLWVEVDRGTEKNEKEFKEKITRIVECIKSGWTRGRPTYILFLIFADTRRLSAMFKWIQEVLNALNLRGGIFRVGLFETVTLTYEQVFFEPIWYQPFIEGRKPLLMV